MHIQAVTYLLAAAVLASLTSAGITWRTADDEHGYRMGEFYNQPYYPAAVEAVAERITTAQDADSDNILPLEQLAMRLLEANIERAAFRRDSRQLRFSPQKPNCRGNICNQRGWKRSWDRRR